MSSNVEPCAFEGFCTCLDEYCRDIARSLSCPKADIGSTVDRRVRQRSSLRLNDPQALLTRARQEYGQDL